jgi:hypothetical protein
LEELACWIPVPYFLDERSLGFFPFNSMQIAKLQSHLAKIKQQSNLNREKNKSNECN